MLRIGKEDTQVGLGDGTVGFHDHRVFFPFFRVDDQVLADKLLCVIHRVLVDELDHQRHRACRPARVPIRKNGIRHLFFRPMPKKPSFCMPVHMSPCPAHPKRT